MFLMWLGEQITERGIGNGISIIIFAGIVARSSVAIGHKTLSKLVKANCTSSCCYWSWYLRLLALLSLWSVVNVVSSLTMPNVNKAAEFTRHKSTHSTVESEYGGCNSCDFRFQYYPVPWYNCILVR